MRTPTGFVAPNLPVAPTEYSRERYEELMRVLRLYFRQLDESNNALRELISSMTGWRDLIGAPTIRSPGANDPTFSVFRGNIRQFKFSQVSMNEMYFQYHIDHDYKPNSDVFIHAHWAQDTVDTGGPAGVPGTVKWYFEVTYAKGHQQAAFFAPITTSVTQQGSTTQYTHNIAEVQLSAASPSASQIDSDILEPDGQILCRIYRDPGDAADTLNQGPFLITCDLHYQTDRICTPSKSPDFYIPGH